ncbi:acyl-CoA dehydrogenase [Alcaligenaceae bacterium C4P045]|nr:acyl-CoA dehydrogenase [Alcaligenaceae bacterium C4P045]
MAMPAVAADRDTLTAFRDSARDFLRQTAPRSRLRKLRQTRPGFERAVWRQMADAGWCGLLAPESLGGLDLGLSAVAVIAEEIGRNLLSEPFIGGAVQTPALLAALPASAFRDDLLARIASGDALIGVAAQTDAARALAGVPRMTREGNALVLDGAAHWIYPGADLDGWIVAVRRAPANAEEDAQAQSPAKAAAQAPMHAEAQAKATHGDRQNVCADAIDALIYVPRTAPGAQAETEDRVDGTTVGSLQLSHVQVSGEHILAEGEAALRAWQHAIACTRAIQSAELLGIARQSFDTTRDYLNTRVQFGKPIGANQALQHRMVDALLHIELGDAALRALLAGDHTPDPTFNAACARVKARCAQAALHMTRLAIQFHGAIGYTDELDVGLYLKRALHLCAWHGGVLDNQRAALPEPFAAVRRDETPAAGVPADGQAGARVDAQADAQADAQPDAQAGQYSAAPSDAARGAENGASAEDWNAMPEQAFRTRIRTFIRAHYPDALRNPPRRLHWHELKSWYLKLSAQGWIAPAWPREYGGMALAPDKLIAFIEEMEDYGVARMPDQGLINIGPVLMRYGTPAQRARYLPRILNGDDVWCQGYSEPNAGSDLASLRTEAIRDGEHFVVNGQKIWTTLAQDATHIFMLVRTDKTVKKQAGISFLLADLKTPGITVKPIRNIGDEEEFCEVFFDNARVPAENLVGELNQGWTIAKALLDFERIFVGSPSQAKYALNQLRLVGQHTGAANDRGFADRYIGFALDVADLQALYADFADMVKRGEPLPASVSLLKIFATETYSRLCMAVVEAAQERGGDAAAFMVDGTQIAPANRLYNSAITTIYGGTNEIQRNILAKAVIGLPS